ncbi:MAG: hypothetical protein ACTSWQ_00235 [Candidatus Thorarchaeota archaeon]
MINLSRKERDDGSGSGEGDGGDRCDGDGEVRSDGDDHHGDREARRDREDRRRDREARSDEDGHRGGDGHRDGGDRHCGDGNDHHGGHDEDEYDPFSDLDLNEEDDHFLSTLKNLPIYYQLSIGLVCYTRITKERYLKEIDNVDLYATVHFMSKFIQSITWELERRNDGKEKAKEES